jgi:hypothetical protein
MEKFTSPVVMVLIIILSVYFSVQTKRKFLRSMAKSIFCKFFLLASTLAPHYAFCQISQCSCPVIDSPYTICTMGRFGPIDGSRILGCAASTDYGITWHLEDTEFCTIQKPFFSALDMVNGPLMYGDAGNIFFRSVDSGKHWTVIDINWGYNGYPHSGLIWPGGTKSFKR